MNVHDGTLSDLLFDEDDVFIDALEEAVERLSLITGEMESLLMTLKERLRLLIQMNGRR